ncbi:MAG: hypothetical protein IJ421_03835 [Prevotella sp.]|nr:hypothetical protein [Prevotella sp.]
MYICTEKKMRWRYSNRMAAARNRADSGISQHSIHTANCAGSQQKGASRTAGNILKINITTLSEG